MLKRVLCVISRTFEEEKNVKSFLVLVRYKNNQNSFFALVSQFDLFSIFLICKWLRNKTWPSLWIIMMIWTVFNNVVVILWRFKNRCQISNVVFQFYNMKCINTIQEFSYYRSVKLYQDNFIIAVTSYGLFLKAKLFCN